MSQSTTLTYAGTIRKAELAVDGDMSTWSHTKCAWSIDLWFKMKFSAVFCFSEVVIIQSHDSYYSARMQDTKVFVINTKTGTEHLCGVLKIRDVRTTEGQTYKINCDLKCGDEVKLKVRHDKSQYGQEGCIHIKEITAFRVENKGNRKNHFITHQITREW